MASVPDLHALPRVLRPQRASEPTKRVAAALAGGLVMLFASTALLVAAYHAPRAKGLDVAVVGSPQQAAAVQSRLDAAARGAFDVRRYATAGAAHAALTDTSVHGSSPSTGRACGLRSPARSGPRPPRPSSAPPAAWPGRAGRR